MCLCCTMLVLYTSQHRVKWQNGLFATQNVHFELRKKALLCCNKPKKGNSATQRTKKDENACVAQKWNFFHSQHKRATQNQIFANTVQISATQKCKFPQHKSSSPVSYRRPLRFPVERRETRVNEVVTPVSCRRPLKFPIERRETRANLKM